MFVHSLILSLLAVILPSADTSIADAAMNGNHQAVQSLISRRADVNAPQGDGSTALHWAALRDEPETARILIAAGANASSQTRLGISPLLIAAQNGSARMIQLLLDAGAPVESVNPAGTTALMMAAASGNTDAVGLLLDRGAEMDAVDKTNGQTALMFAAALNRVSAVQLLIDRGARVDTVSTVLEPRTRDYRSRNEVRNDRREKKGPWLGGLAALHFAAREGHMDTVRTLVDAGANINLVAESDKASAMTLAIMNGHFDIAKYLLDHGADPNLVSDGGLAPLFAVIDQKWAARTWYPAGDISEQKVSHLDLIRDLLAKGADPNVRMGPKLWYRQFHGDWIDPDGATAFWRAAQANDVPAMKLLVAAGADPHIPTIHGCSPLQVAAGYGYEPQVSNFAPDARLETIRYLVDELGADVNSKDDKGYTPLHGIALMGDLESIRYLVSKGANPAARANMIQGRADDSNRDVEVGQGDTIADMANGARERNQVWPEAVALLRELGSEFRNDCKASTCVLNALPDKGAEENK